jgi:hypothetical protein
MLRCYEPVKNSLLSAVDADITPVATDLYGQISSASVRLRLLRRLIPISELSIERNGGPYVEMRDNCGHEDQFYRTIYDYLCFNIR